MMVQAPPTRARRAAILLASVVLFGERLAGAQAQDAGPGGLTPKTAATRAVIEGRMKTARWNLGPLHLLPSASLKDLSYLRSTSTAGRSNTDLTAAVGMGLDGYVHLGPKGFLELFAEPDYLWRLRNEAQRRIAGRYETKAYGFFNRATLTASLGVVRQQSLVSSELTDKFNNQREVVDFSAQVEVGGGVRLQSSATGQRYRNEAISSLGEGVSLSLLDRDERAATIGARYEWRFLGVGLGFESSETIFDAAARDLSHTGRSLTTNATLRGAHFQMDLDVEMRRLRPTEASLFAAFDGPEGNLVVGWTPRGHLRYSVYGLKGLSYSISQSFQDFETKRLGAAIDGSWHRIDSHVFLERGTNDYRSEVVPRRDTINAVGVEASVLLRGSVRLGLGATRTARASSIEGFGRDSLAVHTIVRWDPLYGTRWEGDTKN